MSYLTVLALVPERESLLRVDPGIRRGSTQLNGTSSRQLPPTGNNGITPLTYLECPLYRVSWLHYCTIY